MALFTDAGVVTINDLLKYEGTLVQVASDHDINVDTKIDLATSSIGDRLLLWLLNIGASDPQFLTRRLIGLSTVVVTDPLRRWIVFESLSRIFAEAFNLQLNTRFQGKWHEYQQEAKSAADCAFSGGLRNRVQCLAGTSFAARLVANRLVQRRSPIRANHLG